MFPERVFVWIWNLLQRKISMEIIHHPAVTRSLGNTETVPSVPEFGYNFVRQNLMHQTALKLMSNSALLFRYFVCRANWQLLIPLHIVLFGLKRTLVDLPVGLANEQISKWRSKCSRLRKRYLARFHIYVRLLVRLSWTESVCLLSFVGSVDARQFLWCVKPGEKIDLQDSLLNRRDENIFSETKKRFSSISLFEYTALLEILI